MKLSDKDDPFAVQCSGRIQKFFTYEQTISMMMTLLGSCDLMAKELTDQANILPDEPRVRYAILQFIQIYKVLGTVVRSEVGFEDRPKTMHFPIGEDCWKTDEDFNKRLTLLVKLMYDDLKEKGKID